MTPTIQISNFPDGSAIIQIPAMMGLQGFVNQFASEIVRKTIDEVAAEKVWGDTDKITYDQITEKKGWSRSTITRRRKLAGIKDDSAGRGKMYYKDFKKLR